MVRYYIILPYSLLTHFKFAQDIYLIGVIVNSYSSISPAGILTLEIRLF